MQTTEVKCAVWIVNCLPTIAQTIALLQPFQPGRVSSRAAIPALEFENVFIKQNGSYIDSGMKPLLLLLVQYVSQARSLEA